MFLKIDNSIYKKLCISSKKYLRKFNNDLILLSNPAFFILRESSSEIFDILEFNSFKLLLKIIIKIILAPLKLINNLNKSNICQIKKDLNIAKNAGIYICHKGKNPKSYIDPNKLFIGNEYINCTKFTFHQDSVYERDIWKKNLKQINNNKFSFVPPFMTFQSEFKYSIKTFFKVAKLLKYYFLASNYIDKVVLLNSIYHSISLNNLIALRIYDFIWKNIHKKNISFIQTTYEGYPWERLIYYLGYELGVPRIAFMHAPVSKYQFATFNSISKKFDPDIVICKSKRDIELAINKSLSKTAKFVSVGVKQDKKITNYEYVLKKKNFLEEKNKVLLLPEDSNKEVSIFLDSAIKSLSKVSYLYILRLHPNTSLEKINSLNKKIMKVNKKYNSKRILISENSLLQDIEEASIAVYRGSSAIIYALQNSKILPIYLESRSIMIDPLYYLSNKIIRVKDLSQIPEKIKRYKNKLISPSLADHFDKFNSKKFIKSSKVFLKKA